MIFKKFVQTESHYLKDSDEIETDGYFEEVEIPNGLVLNEIAEMVCNDFFDGSKKTRDDISFLIREIGVDKFVEYYETELENKFCN